jgi:hypothetical protein
MQLTSAWTSTAKRAELPTRQEVEIDPDDEDIETDIEPENC